MMDNLREVVDVVSSNVSQVLHSAPNTLITKHSKSFLDKIPIPKIDTLKWKQGIPTPIIEGSLTPNQEAFGLLTSFATGSIRMRGDVVQHLPTVQGDKSIGDSLQEIPWYSPKKRKVDGSAIHSKKTKITKKEPKQHLVKQTNASLLAKTNPRTQIPDSEIRPENIIPGSPEYVPYKKVKTTGQGRGLKRRKDRPLMPGKLHVNNSLQKPSIKLEPVQVSRLNQDVTGLH